MIVVHLAHFAACEHREAHVRVVIHEPKKRDRLDYSIVNRKSEIRHVDTDYTPFDDWLLENYIFSRNDPSPYYRLNPSSLQWAAEANGPRTSIYLNIPKQEALPTIDVVQLGEYVLPSSDGEPVKHDVVGFFTNHMQSHFKNDDRHETVCYMLNTAKGLAENAFIVHLNEELTKLGYVTLFKPFEDKD